MDMKKLFLDIETLPAEGDKKDLLQEIFEKTKDNGKNLKQSFDSFFLQSGLDGSFGRIFCIGVAVNDESVECLSGDEKEILKKFWEMADDADLFIGHNIFDFDMRFIYQRSAILGVKPTQDLSFARYRNNPIYDTMHEWSKWNMQDKIKLDKIAKAMGLVSSKDGGIDGSKVYEFYKKGKHQEIYDYCKKDVEVTRQVYKKLIFEK
jgi:predicted PolB exonuclease-like 3'-5' exonuclease